MSIAAQLLAQAVEAGVRAQEVVPDAPAAVPAEVSGVVGTLLGWAKAACIIAGVFGLLACAFMLMLGRRNRSQMAVDGAVGLPYVIGGLSIVLLAVPLVNAMF